jgi:hypothetical protein
MDVTPDGQHLVTTAVDSSVGNQAGSNLDDVINVVLNWVEELKARVPTK